MHSCENRVRTYAFYIEGKGREGKKRRREEEPEERENRRELCQSQILKSFGGPRAAWIQCSYTGT